MTWEWVRTWWRFYGDGKQLRLFLFRREGVLVAALPVYLEAIGLPGFGARVARLLGANIPPKVFNPPVTPEASREVWLQVLNRLLAQEGCDLISIGPVCETYKALESLKQVALEGTVGAAEAEVIERDVHTVYYLPRTADEVLASFDAKERKTRRRKLRDLEEKGPVTVDVIKDPAQVEREFEVFAAGHTAQWQSEGRPGHFHAWPRALEYNREQTRIQGLLGRVRFVRLRVGDAVVANQYNFAFGPELFAELPSRAFGPEWDRLGLGGTSQLKLLEAAVAEGFERMESGLGHYEYKLLTGGKEHRLFTVRFKARTGVKQARLAGASVCRQVLQVFSQKIWYRRISPHLPKALRGGQSASAIAFDY
jgi:CelD/BcsL family acetyltransferase involved in cellulose biosynthesis